MLEIFLLIFLCTKMGADLRNKGWSRPIWMQIAVAVVWIGCELLGSIGYCAFLILREGRLEAADHPGFLIYPAALLSATVGVAALFLIAKLLPSRVKSEANAELSPNPQSGANGRQPVSPDTDSAPAAAACRRSP